MSPAVPATTLRLLAIETSTDRLSVALGSGGAGAPVWHFDGPGGAQASLSLLPAVQALLAQAGWRLCDLDALAFGRGPGSFTGLRTACAVAQGLAYGAQTPARPGGVPVLAVDTLLALAQSARETRQATGEPPPKLIVALLDARMDEMYLALHANGPEGVSLEPLQPPVLCRPADFQDHLLASLPAGIAPADCLLAGNVFEVYGAWFSELGAPRLPVWPTAAALLQLAPRLLAQGRAVAAAQALPLYVRDKVAQTTAEREALRLEQLVRLALN